MSIIGSTVRTLDRLGLRSFIAPIASLARRIRTGGRQSFSVSREGYWVNRDERAVIVSSAIHTAPYFAYEQWVVDNWAWDYCPRLGDTVLDIGAGVGEEAVVFSRLVGPGGRVISIEAHPRTFACLRSTIARSGLSNVEAICCAISDRDGTVEIEDNPSYIGNSIMPDSRGSITVPARSIDSLVAELGIERVNLLRVNIEGAERLALAGMANTASHCENVAISCHDFIADAGGAAKFRTFDGVKAELASLGFQMRFRPDHPSPWGRYYIYGRRGQASGRP